MIDRLKARRSYSVNWIWFGIAMVLLLVIGGVLLLLLRVSQASNNEVSDIQCVATYENQNRARSQLLTDLSADRSEALRSLVDAEHAAITYILRPDADPAVSTRLVKAWGARTTDYQHVDDIYNAALKANPLPPPVFSCSSRLRNGKTGASTPVISDTPLAPTPAPSATPTLGRVTTTSTARSTVTRNGTTTVTIPQPGATVTVGQPGPRVTIFRTRTVTRTVMAPNCFSLPPPGLPCTLPKVG